MEKPWRSCEDHGDPPDQPGIDGHVALSQLPSDSGSETGAASRAHVWPDTVSLTAHSALTSVKHDYADPSVMPTSARSSC
jgi:hypothetical protein